MLVSDIIAEVRPLVNDNDAVSYRYTDAQLIIFINDASRRISTLRPDLFTDIDVIPCVAGAVLQSTPNRGRIIEVYQVVDGDAVTEASRETMDQNAPGWRNATAAPAVNWMRHNRNPANFWIYPKAPVAQSLLAEWQLSPPVLAAVGDTIELFDGYQSVLTDMTVAVVEWSDDEHVLSQRAEAFYNRAVQALGVTTQTNLTTDSEESGQAPTKAI